jgi:NAD+ diphosphatase
MPSTEYGFIFQNERLLVLKETSGLRLPTADTLNQHFIRQYPLGTFNETPCICAEISADLALPDELEAQPLRTAFTTLGNDWYGVLAKAISVITWDKNNQFCGRCGHATICKSQSFERSCPACGLSFYPRISPSIIVLIKRDDKILLSRSPHFIKGAYGLIAGFVEVGESIENAVHREVMEEVSLKIKNLVYFGSQAWPFPDSLMIAFTADYAEGEIHLNDKELESADWYSYDNLPGGPSHSISIARKLIDHYIAEQKNRQGE